MITNAEGNNLNEELITDVNGTTKCNICLEDVDNAVVTGCGHVFGRDCLREWAGRSPDRSCPLCRSKGQFFGRKRSRRKRKSKKRSCKKRRSKKRKSKKRSRRFSRKR